MCIFAGLTPLQYLWQRDRQSVLSEMIAAGIHAVLVKISGGGLESKHLGKDLGSLYPVFQRLHERFGLDVCGEGGEYESIVLDCPIFQQRLQIVDSEVVADRNSDDAVGHLKVFTLLV